MSSLPATPFTYDDPPPVGGGANRLVASMDAPSMYRDHRTQVSSTDAYRYDDNQSGNPNEAHHHNHHQALTKRELFSKPPPAVNRSPVNPVARLPPPSSSPAAAYTSASRSYRTYASGGASDGAYDNDKFTTGARDATATATERGIVKERNAHHHHSSVSSSYPSSRQQPNATSGQSSAMKRYPDESRTTQVVSSLNVHENMCHIPCNDNKSLL